MSGPPEDAGADPGGAAPWPTGTWAATQPPGWTKPIVPPPAAPPPPPAQSGGQPPGGFGPPPGYGPPPVPPSPYPPAGWAPPGWSSPGWGPPPAARPGVVPLRPLGLGEILDGAVSTMRKHWKVQLGLTAGVVLVITLVQAAATWLLLRDTGGFDADFLSGDAFGATDPAGAEDDLFGGPAAQAGQAIGIVVGVLAQTVLTGMLTVVVGRAVLGRDATAREAWAQVRPRVWRLLGLSLLLPLMSFGPIAVAVAVPGLLYLAGLPQTPALVLGAVLVALAIPAGIWLWVRFSLAAPAMVLERAGLRTALRRSAGLVRRSWWRVFGILLLIQVMAQLLGQVLAVPMAIAGTVLLFAVGGTGGTVWFVVMITLGSALASLVTYPFVAGVSALLYVDLRMRREGLDLALARSAADPTSPSL